MRKQEIFGAILGIALLVPFTSQAEEAGQVKIEGLAKCFPHSALAPQICEASYTGDIETSEIGVRVEIDSGNEGSIPSGSAGGSAAVRLIRYLPDVEGGLVTNKYQVEIEVTKAAHTGKSSNGSSASGSKGGYVGLAGSSATGSGGMSFGGAFMPTEPGIYTFLFDDGGATRNPATPEKRWIFIDLRAAGFIHPTVITSPGVSTPPNPMPPLPPCRTEPLTLYPCDPWSSVPSIYIAPRQIHAVTQAYVRTEYAARLNSVIHTAEQG